MSTDAPLEPAKVKEKVTLEDYFAQPALTSGTSSQLERAEHLRKACFFAADVLLSTAPFCGDQQAALRKIREVYYSGLAAISLERR